MNFNQSEPVREIRVNLKYLLKWILLSAAVGLVVGVIGAGFYYTLHFVTQVRMGHTWIIALLPAGGLLIVFLYRLSGDRQDRGTNLVLDSVTKGETIPLRKAPLIFAATAITHLFGGSSGREGAALQIGGCIGQNMGHLFRINEADSRTITMCGMSAAFAALFGTPMSAAFLAMEISSVGVLYYSALVPCVLSALIASATASALGSVKDAFTVWVVPKFTLGHAAVCAVIAIICALVSILYCISVRKAGELYRKFFANPYLRIVVGGGIVAAITFISGTTIFNGAGMDIIEKAFSGEVPSYAFIGKLFMTALTLGAGYKGGEIVPSLYIGATFGSAFATWFGFDYRICAAIGCAALFCGITNCPIATLLLCFEMFGYAGMPYYLIAIALAYVFSGYYSVYSSQKFVYAKTENKFVNRKPNE